MKISPFLYVPCLLVGLVGFSLPAMAHIQMDSPTARSTQQKNAPCGSDTPSANRTEYAPGETITVVWRETINHPSHYRIAFDDDGSDDFSYPTGPDDFSDNGTVLLDNIEDANGGQYSATVALPNINCENCTLQLIQAMYDKQGNGWGNDDLYFQCADIAIRGELLDDGSDPPANEGGPTDDEGGGGCSSNGGKGELLALVMGLGAFFVRRR
jgi:hypothetical protein